MLASLALLKNYQGQKQKMVEILTIYPPATWCEEE